MRSEYRMFMQLSARMKSEDAGFDILTIFIRFIRFLLNATVACFMRFCPNAIAAVFLSDILGRSFVFEGIL